MKKLLTLAAIFAVVFVACPTDDGNNGGNTKTTLTIENVSDYDIFDVEYGSVNFGSINRGKNNTKEVEAGTRYIFFSLKVNNNLILCRTEAVTCEEKEKTNFNITNNSSITVTANDKRDTLRNIFNTLSSIPGNLRVTSVTENSISLTWNTVNEAAGYNIYRSTSQSGTYSNLNVNVITGMEFTDTTVSSNVIYWYSVSAVLNGMETVRSNPISATTLLPAPVNLTVEAFADTSVSLAWNTVNGANSYNVYRSTSETGTYIKANTNAITGTNFTDTGVSSNTAYYYYVCGVSSGIEGTKSSSVSCTTLMAAPANVRTSTVTDISISLTWDNIIGSDSYNVYRSSSADGSYNKINTDIITNNEYTDTNVSSNAAYFYRVSSLTDSIESARSAVVSITTRLPVPANVLVSAVTLASVSLTWDTVNGATGYNIYRSGSENGTYTKLNTSLVTLRTYSDTGLPSNTVCYYKVCAVANSIEGIYSTPVSASTLTPAPSELRASAITNDSIGLAWNSLTGVVGYNIYRSTSEYGTYNKVNSGEISGAEFTDSSVSSNTTYYYKVSSVAANTESILSNPIHASTGTVVSGNDLTAKLNWLDTNAVSNTRYVIELTSDEYISPRTLSYSGKSGITVTLVGIGAPFNISLNSGGRVFTVNTGVTLVINNITLKGNNYNVVRINGGTMIMNGGTKITGGTADSSDISGFVGMGGGGVVISSGQFLMNGGEISDNTALYRIYSNSIDGGGVYILDGTFILNNGKINGNRCTANDSYGGGVCVSSRGTFIMKGGEIFGNRADRGGGIYGSLSSIIRMSGGVIYGSNATTGYGNTAVGGAAFASYSTLSYGTYNGDTFYPTGSINGSDNTIRIVDGNLLTE
jgi:fibronectin type 3 domain-containing protein